MDILKSPTGLQDDGRKRSQLSFACKIVPLYKKQTPLICLRLLHFAIEIMNRY